MFKAFHPRDSIGRLNISTKEERGLTCTDASVRGFHDYIKKRNEKIIRATRNSTVK